MDDDNVKKNWEVLIPVPLILDESVSDEAIISELASITSDSDVQNIFSTALKFPTEGYIIRCSKEELFQLLLDLDIEGVILEVEEYENIIVLIVKDKENSSIIGRGEISEVSAKVNKTFLKTKFSKEMKNFKEKFIVGQNRMNSLAFKLKLIKDGMAMAMTNKNKN